MSERPVPPAAFTVLLVCTGNICRSALAERLGRGYLAETLGEHAGAIRLVSAGTQAVVGSTMHPDSTLVLQGYGGEPGDFRARQLDERIAAEADLTLTMTRAHRAGVLKLAPRALARTFTLREAADILELLGDELDVSGESPQERGREVVRLLAEARSRRRVDHGGDDVPDPIGRPLEAHEQAGEMIAAALIPVLESLAAAVVPDAGLSAEHGHQDDHAGHRAVPEEQADPLQETARISPAV